MLGEFKTLAQEQGFSSEQATKVATWYSEKAQAAAQEATASWKAQGTQWLEEFKAHPEFGGKNFEASCALAQTGMRTFCTKEEQEMITEFGLMSFPVFTGLFRRLGKAGGEDNTGGLGSVQVQQQSRQQELNELYPNSPELHKKTE